MLRRQRSRDYLTRHGFQVDEGVAEDYVADAFTQCLIVCVGEDLVPEFNYHAVITAKLVPLVVVRISPQPGPI